MFNNALLEWIDLITESWFIYKWSYLTLKHNGIISIRKLSSSEHSSMGITCISSRPLDTHTHTHTGLKITLCLCRHAWIYCIKWYHPYPQPPCATAQRRPLLQCEPLHRCYMFLLLVHSEISAQHECKPSHLQIDTNSKIKALFWNKAFNILQKKRCASYLCYLYCTEQCNAGWSHEVSQ